MYPVRVQVTILQLATLGGYLIKLQLPTTTTCKLPPNVALWYHFARNSAQEELEIIKESQLRTSQAIIFSNAQFNIIASLLCNQQGKLRENYTETNKGITSPRIEKKKSTAPRIIFHAKALEVKFRVSLSFSLALPNNSRQTTIRDERADFNENPI